MSFNKLNGLVPLDMVSEIFHLLEKLKLPKNHMLHKQGTICNHIYLIEKGVANINSAGEVEPFNADLYEMAKLSHKVSAYFFAALISLHIVAVLKHHFVDRDRTLIRMLNVK